MTTPDVGQGKRGTEGHLLYLLRQANAAVGQAMDRQLAEFGLSLAQYSALTMIAAYEDLSSADLARISMLTPQSANETVQRLVAAELIRRRKDATNRRILRLEITEQGRDLLTRARRRSDKVEWRLLQRAQACGGAAVRKWLVDVAVELGAGAPIVDRQ